MVARIFWFGVLSCGLAIPTLVMGANPQSDKHPSRRNARVANAGDLSSQANRDDLQQDFRTKMTAAQVAAAAKRIDELIEADLARHSLKPNPPAPDEVFLRRAYLDVTGTIPNLSQTRSFLNSKSPNRRAELIDELLNSPGYASHFFNYWADLLRITSRLQVTVGDLYIDWVKQALASNMPYDQFVYELVAAEGKYFENPATGYYVRDSGMPLDNTSNTVRVFLGTSIGCAQCHDHPFDKWSQYEFYEMAAFTYGIETRDRDRRLFAKARRADLDPRAQAVLRRMIRAQSFGAMPSRRQLRLPEDYKYSDAKPRERVEPATIFGKLVEPGPSDSPRRVYARWLTSPDNPRFTRVIANRMWKKLMGVGVFEPVDEITDGTEPVNPELMAHLEQLMKDLDYDIRAYLRVLLNTKTYQRMATPVGTGDEDVYRFPGPQLRRMSAEQVWDSLLTLTIPNPDGRKVAQLRSNLVAELTMATNTPEEMIELARSFTEDRRKIVREMRTKAMRTTNQAQYRGFPRDLARASELRSPAPAGHFLRQFGQSDRELIDGANTQPSVTQVLTLLNGLEDTLLKNPRSVLRTNVAATDTRTEKINAIFLSVLNRFPRSHERAAALREVRNHGDEAYANVAWALVNTREFLFVQ